jgi:hypothetical protein
MRGRLFCFMPIILVLAFLLVTAAAHAHSWYPSSCCSGRDCDVLAESRVSAHGSGYIVDGRFIVPPSQVRRSMDGRFHGCFPTPNELRCFWAPPVGF